MGMMVYSRFVFWGGFKLAHPLRLNKATEIIPSKGFICVRLSKQKQIIFSVLLFHKWQ
jgi:hypothetical protein